MASLRLLAPARLVFIFLCCLPAVALAIVGGAEAKKPDAPPGLAGKNSGPAKAKGHGGAGKAPRGTAGGGHGKGHGGGHGRGAAPGAGAAPPGHGAGKGPAKAVKAKGEGRARGRGKVRHGGKHAPAQAAAAPTLADPGPPAPSGTGQDPSGAGPGGVERRRTARRRGAQRERGDRPAGLDALGRGLPGVAGATGAGEPASPLDRLAAGAGGGSGGDAGEAGEDAASGGPLFRLLSPGAAGRLAGVVPPRVQWLAAALGALLSFLAFGTLLGWWRARRLERQRERLLEEVGLLQAALLPAVPERLGSLRASVAYRPWEGPGAGGDFYDAFPLGPDRVGLVIGDVSGHGREVLSRTAAIRYTLRAYLEAGLEPRAALALGGRVLDGNFDAGFATVMLAVHDAAAGTLTYAGAGHPPPILLGPPAHDPVTACASPPIGAGLATGLRQTTVAMPPGAVACLFTDGLVEARTPDGMLGRERLAALVEGLGPDATARDLLARVASRAEEVGDDMAVCVLRADAGGAPALAEPPPPRAEPPLRTEELALEGEEIDSSAIQRFLWACGAPGGEARPAIDAARSTAAESGGAVVRVEIDRRRARVEVVAPEEEASPAGLGHRPRLAGVDG